MWFVAFNRIQVRRDFAAFQLFQIQAIAEGQVRKARWAVNTCVKQDEIAYPTLQIFLSLQTDFSGLTSRDIVHFDQGENLDPVIIRSTNGNSHTCTNRGEASAGQTPLHGCC